RGGRRHHHGAAHAGDGQHRRLPGLHVHPRPHAVHGRGRLQGQERRSAVHVRLHQHDHGGRLPRGRTPRGRVLPRAAGRHRGGRARQDARRGAESELHRAGRLPVRHAHRAELRLRRVRPGPQQGPAARQRGEAAAGAEGPPHHQGPHAARHRPGRLRRDVRLRPLRERGRPRGAVGHGDGLHGHVRARPGPRDDVRPDHRRPPGRGLRQDRGTTRRHRGDPSGQRHRRQPQPGRRGYRHLQRLAEGAGEGPPHRRRHAGGGVRGRGAGQRPLPGEGRPGQAPGAGRHRRRGLQRGPRQGHRARPGGDGFLPPAAARLCLRRARGGGGGGPRDGHRPAARLRVGGRLRRARVADARGRPGARRPRPGHRAVALGRARLQRRRPAHHRLADGLRGAARRGPAVLPRRGHRDEDAVQSPRRQGHRRGGHHRLDAGRRQRGGRRAAAARREAPGHAAARDAARAADHALTEAGRTPLDSAALLKELVAIGIAIAGEPHLRRLLDLTLSGALRLTRAEAGAIYLLKPEGLEFALVKNPVLTRRYGEAEVNGRFEGQRLPLDGSSLAGYVASTGQALNVPDAYRIPPTAPYQLQGRYDRENQYQTRSVLSVPLTAASGAALGVLQIINALDDNDELIAFTSDTEEIAGLLAAYAAVAIRNVQLAEHSLNDHLTGAFNRRYVTLRLDEEISRTKRTGEPLSFATVDIDHFKAINDQHGHPAGDAVIRAVAQLLINQSRAYTVVARYGGDE